MPAEADANFFAHLSRDLVGGGGDPGATIEAIVRRSLDSVGPATWAGVTLRRRRGRFESLGITDPLVERLDDAQYELREGPCLDAATDEGYYLSRDLTTETRWPSWAPRAAQAGVRSVLAIQLSGSEGPPLGALNLYGADQEWTTQDLDLALVFAIHAANAIASTRLVDSLRTGMHSRHLIGMAQGVLLVDLGLEADQSFELLRRLSSHHNVRLQELAEDVVRERRLPERFRV